MLAAVFSFIVFYTIQRFIFKSKKPFEYTLYLFPILTFFINVLFIIYKGSPNLELDEMELWKCMLISIGIGLITALGSQFLYLPYVKRKINYKKDED